MCIQKSQVHKRSVIHTIDFFTFFEATVLTAEENILGVIVNNLFLALYFYHLILS